MMKVWINLFAAFLLWGMVLGTANTVFALPAVTYSQMHFPGEDSLQTVVAEKWLKVSDEAEALEGLCFDRTGNLWMVGVETGRVYKVTPDKNIHIVTVLKDRRPAGLKIHKDGRIFVACLGNGIDTGSVVSFNPDGTGMKIIVPETGGYTCDDLFFDNKGGFYFTNYKGYYTNQTGTVEYVSPDYKTITTVAKGLSGPNGIVMSPKNPRMLIVSECHGSRLSAFQLEPDGVTPYIGSVLSYYQACFPDSLDVDEDGNLYQAMSLQGRYVVLNSLGNPFAQIVIPERVTGHMLQTTHSAIIPGTNQIIVCASDMQGGQGTALYTALVPAKAWNGYYQFQ